LVSPIALADELGVLQVARGEAVFRCSVWPGMPLLSPDHFLGGTRHVARPALL
jgi:hypothetical protein